MKRWRDEKGWYRDDVQIARFLRRCSTDYIAMTSAIGAGLETMAQAWVWWSTGNPSADDALRAMVFVLLHTKIIPFKDLRRFALDEVARLESMMDERTKPFYKHIKNGQLDPELLRDVIARHCGLLICEIHQLDDRLADCIQLNKDPGSKLTLVDDDSHYTSAVNALAKKHAQLTLCKLLQWAIARDKRLLAMSMFRRLRDVRTLGRQDTVLDQIRRIDAFFGNPFRGSPV